MFVHRRSLLTGAAALATMPGATRAQTARPISLIVPYAPGGGTDIVAREFAPLFSQALDRQTVVVENRAGAAGHVGSVAVARARPDGLTLLFAVSTNIVINPHLQRGERIDLSTALAAVGQVSSYQYVLVVNPSLGVSTVAELIALSKRRPPGDLTFSSSGVGGNNHLAGVLFAEAAGIRMEHIPYRGTAPALMDVVAGAVNMNFSSPPPAISLVREGRVKALAVTGPTRMASLPEVPTLEEAGMPGVVILGWHGLFAPAGTPDALLDRYAAAARSVATSAHFAGRLANDGLDVAPDVSRAAFGRAVREETAFWANKVRELDLKAE